MAGLSLYEIDATLQYVLDEWEKWAIEHDGDVTDFPLSREMDALTGDLETKALNVACVIKSMLAEAQAINDERKRLEQREKIVKHKAERLKAYLKEHINPGVKYENARASIKWRRSEGLVVNAPMSEIPKDFIKFGEPSVKVAELKAAVKAGLTIKGVDLEQRINIVIG